ncbi:MAG: ABC transporter ATP-binding protein [Candidatus Tectomicrobia bacterium]|uniref:ABC transporter ATP-binding protein n=1 Tax=Tectimicrobiota bacterium TaxID=2528274 RepID=A0A932GQQ7_UNCTE|nr:ABC transporter ATP-binding protein [Candidatus Tectomicrobia bacterium]
MPLIEVVEVWKNYLLGEVRVEALRGVSVAVERGEFVAITGPSGSGKSTLMHILGCLDLPDRGDYWLDEDRVTQMGSDERARLRNEKIGFVFQNFFLMSRTSARENVELPLLYTDTPAKKRREIARRMLQRVGLQDREEHFPNQLSGGQQQRVAIARALVNHPPLLLADEPTGNLDSQTGQEIIALFQALNMEEGVTIVIVTHEPDIAAQARRQIRFRDGVIAEDSVRREVALGSGRGEGA